MKRSRSRSTPIVRLNVGGRAFDTTRETLSACVFRTLPQRPHGPCGGPRRPICCSAGTSPSHRETRRLKHRLLAEAGFDVPI